MHISHFQVRVLNKLRLLSGFNGSTTIRVNQKKFQVPLLGRQGLDNLNLSEPWMTETLLALRPIFKGGFVDVGVNLGQTLIKAQAVFDELNYIGFEPNPACITYVQELARQNGMKNTTLFPIAVGAKTEMLRLNFFDADTSGSAATIVENFRPYSTTDHFIFVPVFDFHLVSHFLPASPMSILKIDVEGAELDVLLGLDQWIITHQPVILMEILPVYVAEHYDRLDRQQKIEELMRGWHYKISRIKKKNPVSLEKITEVGIHSNIEDCDYLLYHESAEHQIFSCFNSAN
jgi:FkbM family methyltransferase